MKNKTVIFIVILIAIIGCEKIPDGVVDPRDSITQFKFNSLQMPDTVIYGVDDSVIVIKAKMDNPDVISRLFFDIYDTRGEIVSRGNDMKDNGDVQQFGDSLTSDGIYSAIVSFGKSDPSGAYFFKFYGVDIHGIGKLLAEKRTVFFNNQPLFPPVISNLVMPDSVAAGEVFVFSLRAEDGNGLSDIKKVYFDLYRPDGSHSVNPTSSDGHFPMYDNGDINGSGDVTAGDGIYTLKNSFGASAQKGYWKFEFQAVDRSDSLSNEIIKELLVK